jgi:hypothetical protein
VYADPSIRPARIDEAHARVLCGEPPPADAASDVRDLAETVRAVHGDDAPSRALLAEIARRVAARAIVVVRIDAGRASARVFLPDQGVFDAATYSPDEGTPLSWNSAVQSLVRSYALQRPSPAPSTAAVSTSAPALATREQPTVPAAPARKKAFYESGWFWGAIGAAAFAGGAIFLATRDNSDPTIHLQVQVPH